MANPNGQKGVPAGQVFSGRPGFTLENMPSIFQMHSHRGGLDGALLTGPYYIVDSVTKKTRQIVCKNGVLSVE